MTQQCFYVLKFNQMFKIKHILKEQGVGNDASNFLPRSWLVFCPFCGSDFANMTDVEIKEQCTRSKKKPLVGVRAHGHPCRLSIRSLLTVSTSDVLIGWVRAGVRELIVGRQRKAIRQHRGERKYTLLTLRTQSIGVSRGLQAYKLSRQLTLSRARR